MNAFRPVDDVTEKRGYRMPTEEEWEFFCRAGTSTLRHFGNDSNLLNEYAWLYGNAREVTQPTATRLPNAFGIFDTLGNVGEWCHGVVPARGSTAEPNERRPFRGGSTYSAPTKLRSSACFDYEHSFTNRYVGFRIVQTLPDKGGRQE